MKYLVVAAFFSLFLAFAGCTSDTGQQPPSNQGIVGDTSRNEASPTDTAAPTPPTKPNCQIAGKALENNQLWASKENLLVAIVADKETEDPTLGESHRILEIYDGSTCQQVFRQVLPVNLSADYPYYLSDVTYNKVSGLVAIRGFDKLYVLDLSSKKLSEPLAPKFMNQRYVDDAQSGSISRIEVWENYLIGHAASMGPFVFDLSNPAAPVAVLPFAEFALEKGVRYNSLFMLKSLEDGESYQALLPSFDYEKEEFNVNPLFAKPLKLFLDPNKKYKNNRYIVVKEILGPDIQRPVAIDMGKPALVEVPKEMADKKVTEIIEWMKKR